MVFDDFDLEDSLTSGPLMATSGISQPVHIMYNNALFEWFKGISTMFSLHWSDDTCGIKISLSQDPILQGHRKDVHLVCHFPSIFKD